MKPLKQLVVAILLSSTAGFSHATDLEVTHWWTSGGEAAAVKVLADAFDAGGDKWVDAAIAGGSNARPVIISRISGGDPMGATQMNTGRDAEGLVQAGLMTDLTALAEKEGWKDFIRPSKLLDTCTYDGKIYCVPVNIHSWQWMWLNRKVFEDNQLSIPSQWSELVAESKALKEKGIIPLALGGEAWQITGAFNTLLVAIGGVDLYRKINVEKSTEAVASESMTKVLEAFATARDMVDAGITGRSWNDATNMVITGKATAQIMGDWAQGEFAVAGKDYDCLPGLGMNPVLDTSGDAFYFPKPKDNNPEIVAAQLRLASLLVSKQVQVDFNLKKGSLPIRGDIDMAVANSCMQKGVKLLENPDNVLPSTEQIWDSDTQGQFEDLLVEFFSAPEMSVAEAQARYVEIVENAL